MSQIYKQSSGSGPTPPDVPTSFVTDVNSPAVPAGNVLNVPGGTIDTDNPNGIETDGSSGSNTLTVQLTNRVIPAAPVQTVGAVTVVATSFTPTVIGTYTFEYRVSAYNTTSSLGASYQLYGGARFDGVNSHSVGEADTLDNEEGAMSACDLDLTISGAAIQLSVTGYAAQTINWNCVGLYTFIGA